MSLAVEVKGLVKVFDSSIKAVDNLSFTIQHGEVYGLIGPNGAGKTTTLRIIATLIQPTSGFIRVFGHDVAKEASEVRSLITYLPEEAGAYKNLKGAEYLEFMASFGAKSKDEVKNMVEEATKITELGPRLKDKVKTYSKGMKRRLLVARALMSKPKLAILDEPTSGLDVIHSYNVRNIIREYVKNQDVTVLLSSHNMLEVEYLCDKISLINNGRSISEGSPKELKDKFDASNLEEAFVKAAGIA